MAMTVVAGRTSTSYATDRMNLPYPSVCSLPSIMAYTVGDDLVRTK